MVNRTGLQTSLRTSLQTTFRALTLGTLGLFALNGCDCTLEELDKVAPKIEIGDPLSEDGTFCDEEFRVQDCKISFADTGAGAGQFVTFLIENPSPVELDIKSIELGPNSDPAFTIVTDAPETVAPQKDNFRGAEIVVRFAPDVEGTASATLIIKSNAVNLEKDEDLIIEITGNGLDLGRPRLVINPAECSFGDVGIGVTAFCDLTLENQGTRDLEITGIGFSADTDLTVFGAQTVIPIPSFVAPGTGMSLRLFAKPEAAGVVTGALTLSTNDRDAIETIVPMSVNGAQAPTAIPEILSVNGVPYAATVIGPLDDVILTGANSVPALPEDSIVGYQWEIVTRPNESSLELTDPSSMNTGFFFSSAGGNFQGLDVVGSYTVRLVVTDSNGAMSSNEGTLSINAIPLEALHVQLTWDSPTGDIDLHMVKDSGSYCGSDSCYFSNCKPQAFSPPEWDGASGRGAGDPYLDVDDLTGYGPENINVDQPVNGAYKIAAAYYSGTATTWVTAKIFINGALQYESSREFASGAYWEVAQVDWNNGAALITPIDGSTQPSGSCFGF